MNLWVPRLPLADEVYKVVFSLVPDKSLGLDEFFKHFWSIMNQDIMELINEFFNKRSSLKHINSTFLTLILKLTTTNPIIEFRPISRVNTIYKIIAKIQGNRLVEVTLELFSLNQSSFTKV